MTKIILRDSTMEKVSCILDNIIKMHAKTYSIHEKVLEDWKKIGDDKWFGLRIEKDLLEKMRKDLVSATNLNEKLLLETEKLLKVIRDIHGFNT